MHIGRVWAHFYTQHEKSKVHFDIHWPFLCNAIIDNLDLREVSMVGRQFTWANSLPDPTYEKLDRVLMDTDWEEKYPMVSVRALEHIERLSNDAPILLTTGIPKPLCKRPFNFDGFSVKDFMIWSRMFGIDQLVATLQY
jgi:hypothetical protein